MGRKNNKYTEKSCNEYNRQLIVLYYLDINVFTLIYNGKKFLGIDLESIQLSC